jgi:Flp pilus assembly pilin Flp
MGERKLRKQSGLARRGGQGMVEYILIVALIAILVIAGIRLFGGQVKDLFQSSAEKIQSESNDAIQGN